MFLHFRLLVLNGSLKKKAYRYKFKSIGSCCQLTKIPGFAIVDIGNDLKGKAFLLNLEGQIIFEIKRKEDMHNYNSYYDVFYEEKNLCFIFNNDNIDYKLIFDEKSKVINDVFYIRW